MLGHFRPVAYSFPQWLGMAIGSPTYGLLCLFCLSLGASLTHLLSLGFLGPFISSTFPWAFTNFIGLPWPNYLIVILGVHGLAISPLLSLFALLWACSGHSHFSLSYVVHGYTISLFSGFFKPICLFKTHLFISWACDPLFLPLGPNGFVICLPTLCCLCCWAFFFLPGFSKNDP